MNFSFEEPATDIQIDKNLAETPDKMSQDQTTQLLSTNGPARTLTDMENRTINHVDTTWLQNWENSIWYLSTALTPFPSLGFSEISVPIHTAPLPQPAPCLAISKTLVVFEVTPTLLVTSSPASLKCNTTTVSARNSTLDLPNVHPFAPEQPVWRNTIS